MVDANIKTKVQELHEDVITVDSFIEYVFTIYGVETEADADVLLAELNAVTNKDKTRQIAEALIKRIPKCHVRMFVYYTNILVELGRMDLLSKELISYKSQFGEDRQSALVELFLLLQEDFESNADKIIALTERIK